MKPEALVFDRTESLLRRENEMKSAIIKSGWEKAPVEAKEAWTSGFKCSLSARMFNRMENWVYYIKSLLEEKGYKVSVRPKRTWVDNEQVFEEDVHSLVDNINALRNGFSSIPDWVELAKSDTMDIILANGMEYDLQLCYNLLERSDSITPRTGQGLVEKGYYPLNE